MIRTVLLSGAVLSLAACTPGEKGPRLVHTEVVNNASVFPNNPRLSPDGTRLAYDAPVDGLSAIYAANPDGSNPVRLTHGAWDEEARWSPDGKWIAYYSDVDADVWVVPSGGGEPRQLTSGPANDTPQEWLPDGSGVVFIRRGAGDVQTLVAPLDGGPVSPLVAARGGNQWVTVSRDGSKAAFDLHKGGEGTIWVQDLVGGEARQLTTEGLENAQTENMWSPDGTRLAFVSRRTGTLDLWTADVTSGTLTQITNDVRNDGNQYDWSPDGRWIAFLSDRGGQWDIWIVASSGGPASRVTNDLAFEGDIRWAKDGRTLFYRTNQVQNELQVMPTAGGAFRRLAGWPGYTVGGAQVSPDGKTVLFWSNRSGNSDIWSVPFAGGEPVPFAAGPPDEIDMWFSPDGSQVLFESNRGGSLDLWMMPAAGGEARRLTEWPSREADAAWSPDGTMIAFESDYEASAPNVWVMPSAGGEPRQLTQGADVNDIRWSPDGRSIYYVGGSASGTKDLYRVSLAGGPPRALGASRGIGNGELSPDGTQFAYADFERAWAFIEVIPAAGGRPRRLTTDTSLVYHSLARWTPDGTRLVVGAYDLDGFRGDLMEVTWPGAVWRRLTESPVGTFQGLQAFSPDGREIVVQTSRNSSRIMSVEVAGLLGN